MRNDDCQYFNDIKGCNVVTVYECGDFIEIVYIKEGVQKSLVIEYHTYGGSMGYGSFFRFSGVELPQHVFRGERMCTKMLSETLTRMQSIIEINLYRNNAQGYGDSEELEIVYETKDGKKETYLLDFVQEDDDDAWLQKRCRHNKKAVFEKQMCDDSQIPTELFSTAVYKEVLAFALKAHGEQKTPEGLPYSFHIVSVATEILNSLSQHRISYEEANVAISCALLHDVSEDTDTTIGTNSLNIPNIRTVLQGVWALTKNEKLPTKQEQMQDLLERLQIQPKCVQMVKLADRITNLAPAPLFWNRSKRRSYVKEAKMILDALKSANPYLAQKLQDKIDSYVVDKVKNKFGEEKNDDYVVFYAKDFQLILDKCHPDYLKTFKALNRLNAYVFNTYDIRLFKRKHADYDWANREKEDIVEYTHRVGVKYITSKLNTKDLLDLNKHTDENIAKYFAVILDGEGCIV